MRKKHGSSSHHMGKKAPPKGTVHRKDHHDNGKHRAGGKRTSRLASMKI